MNRTALIWDPGLAAYDLGDGHPLNPLRLTLTVELMESLGLLTPDRVLKPVPATEPELLTVHSVGYIEAVRHAGDWASDFRPTMGLGTDDNPVYPGMHEIAALTAGGSILAMEAVLSGQCDRTFAIAGGMHHAHRARAAGFSVYNDASVAIAVAREKHPGLRVLYIDIDAHHGDGVQEMFAGTPDVMTISIHESGLYAFPGTGFPGEIGYDAGTGYAVNVPLPRLATDDCFEDAFDQVAAPLARAFKPDVIVAQLGVDAHYADPQTELGMTLQGYRSMVRRVIALADELCDGKLVALGGGGYHAVAVVPVAWSWVFAELCGVDVGDRVPEEWQVATAAKTGGRVPVNMGRSDSFSPPAQTVEIARAATKDVIAEVRTAVFPLHSLTP